MINLNVPGTPTLDYKVLNEDRKCTFIIPQGFKPATGKLFFFFKGQSGKIAKFSKLFSKYLAKENYIGIFPEAIQRGGDPDKKWALDQSHTWAKDHSFFCEILETNPEFSAMPVLVSGVSNGGCFALTLGTIANVENVCTFAASAWTTLHHTYVPNVYAIHGMLDRSVPYIGGLRHELVFLDAKTSILTFVPKNTPVTTTNWSFPNGGFLETYISVNHKSALLSVAGSGHDVLTSYKGIDLIQSMFDFFKPFMINNFE